VSGESLIAAPRDTASPLSGTLLLEDGAGLVSAINSRSWVDAAVSGAATALDVAAAVANPLATVVAMGVGWVLDHIEPLKSWLNDLTGDAGQVQAFAATWHNIDTAVGELAARLGRRVTGDLYELAGAAADAYRALQADLAKMLGAAGTWAGAMGAGLEIAATIVQAVHDIVRDAISQIVGMAVQSAAEVALSVGLATPAVVAQVATKTASMAASIGRKVTGVERSLRSLEGLLEKLKGLFHDLGGKLDGVLHGGGGEAARSGRTGAAAAPAVESSEFDHFVAFFDGESYKKYWNSSDSTLGPRDKSFFVMPVEDSAAVHNAGDAARYTGMSPATQRAYTQGGDVYGISFPAAGYSARLPTAEDAGHWAHFLEGGHTAVRTEGPKGGFLINPTRERVIPGGGKIPAGAVIFKLGSQGEWIIVRRSS
jgi:hypothetical protein